MSTYKMTNFNALNFRKQGSAFFAEEKKQNPSTGKQETYYDIKNDAGYGFKVMTPPCNALFPHLGSGGNFGGKFSKTQQTSKLITNILKDGEDDLFKSERTEFFSWQETLNEQILGQMYDADPAGAASACRAKITKRYGKKKTPEECESMARKAFLKNAMVPLKTKDGEDQMVIKCRAFNKDGTPRPVRYVQESGDQYVEMEETPSIRNGALLCLPFQIRPFVMAKDKYGITYTLLPDVVVLSTGKGRVSAPMEDIETPERPYKLSIAEGKEGKQYLNINDSDNRRFTFRPVATEVVFSDLGGVGTLGKIAGVTEDNAKYSGTTKENIDNETSVSFFNYAKKLSDDIVDFCIADPSLLTKLKADSKEEAEEMAEVGGESFEHCFRTVIKDAFNSPINKRDEDEYRQLRFSQRVFTYGENKQQNKIPLTDASGAPLETEIRRGAMIAPVLTPSVYFMADGKFGLKFDISLEHGIRVENNPEATPSSSGIIYSLKRARGEEDAPESKRAKTEDN
jgi:hypothetical protein